MASSPNYTAMQKALLARGAAVSPEALAAHQQRIEARVTPPTSLEQRQQVLSRQQAQQATRVTGQPLPTINVAQSNRVKTAQLIKQFQSKLTSTFIIGDKKYSGAQVSKLLEKQLVNITNYIRQRTELEKTLANLRTKGYDAYIDNEGNVVKIPPKGMDIREQVYLEILYAPKDTKFTNPETKQSISKDEALVLATKYYGEQQYELAQQLYEDSHRSWLDQLAQFFRLSGLVISGRIPMQVAFGEVKEKAEWKWAELTGASAEAIEKEFQEAYAAQLKRIAYEAGTIQGWGEAQKIGTWQAYAKFFSPEIITGGTMIASLVGGFVIGKITPIAARWAAAKGLSTLGGFKIGTLAKAGMYAGMATIMAPSVISSISVAYNADLQLKKIDLEYQEKVEKAKTEQEKRDLEREKEAKKKSLERQKEEAIGFLLHTGLVLLVAMQYGKWGYRLATGPPKIHLEINKFTGEVTAQKYRFEFPRLKPRLKYGPKVKLTVPTPTTVPTTPTPSYATTYKPPTAKAMKVIPGVAPGGAVPFKLYTPPTYKSPSVKGPGGIEVIKPTTPLKVLTPSTGKYPGPSKLEFPNLELKVGPGGIRYYKPKTPTKVITPSTGKYVGPSRIEFANLIKKVSPEGFTYYVPKVETQILTPSQKQQMTKQFPNLEMKISSTGIEYYVPKVETKVLTPSTGKYLGPSGIKFLNLERKIGPGGIEYYKSKIPVKILTPSTGKYLRKELFPKLIKKVGPTGGDVWIPKVPSKVITPATGIKAGKFYPKQIKWRAEFGMRKKFLPSTKVWPKPKPYRAYETYYRFFTYEPMVGIKPKPIVSFKPKSKVITMKDLIKKGVIKPPTEPGVTSGRQKVIQITKQITKQKVITKQINQELIQAQQQALKLKSILKELMKQKHKIHHQQLQTQEVKQIQLLRHEQYQVRNQIQILLSKQKQANTQIQVLLVAQDQSQGQEKKLVFALLSAQAQAKAQVLVQAQIQAQALTTKQVYAYQFKPATGILGVVLPKYTQLKRREKQQSYHTFVKKDATVKGKTRYVRVTEQPLPKRQALGKGAQITDHTVSRTFKVKKSEDKPKSDMRYDMSWGALKHKFRKPIKKGKSKIKSPKWIEKTTHAIDSRGEFEGITVKGWAAIKKKKPRRKQRPKKRSTFNKKARKYSSKARFIKPKYKIYRR